MPSTPSGCASSGCSSSLALGCREDVSIGFAVLGFFWSSPAAARKKVPSSPRSRRSTSWRSGSFIMPAIGAWGLLRSLQGPDSRRRSRLRRVVKTLATNPLLHAPHPPDAGKAALCAADRRPAGLPAAAAALAGGLADPRQFLTLLTTGYGPDPRHRLPLRSRLRPLRFPGGGVGAAGARREEKRACRGAGAAATLLLASLIATADWGAFPPRRVFHSATASSASLPPPRRSAAD